MNRCDDITGVLFFQNQTFLQAVEGPADKIDDLVQRLSSDKRHHHMEILVQTEIQQRYFPDWNMATINLHDEELFTQETLTKLLEAYRKNVRISDAGFVVVLQSLLNNPDIEQILR